MGSEKDVSVDVQSDLSLLLDCLKLQNTSRDAKKQALQTVATICSDNEKARGFFLVHGGLHILLELLFESVDCSMQRIIMFTLGCATDSNSCSQSELCSSKLFPFVEGLLCDENRSADCCTAAAYLVGVTVAKNNLGQTQARDSGILKSLIDIARRLSSNVMLHDERNKSSQRLWDGVMAALTNCMSNPHNEENQKMSSQAFPAVVAVLSQSAGYSKSSISHSASFLAACCSSNERNQARLSLVGGLECLIHLLQSMSSENGPCGLSDLSVIASVLNTLTAAVAGNERSCQSVTDLQVIPLLIKFLSVDADEQFRLQVVLTVGYCIESCENAQKLFMSAGGLGQIVEHLAHSKSEQLKFAITYILQCCLKSCEGDADVNAVVQQQGDQIASLLTDAHTAPSLFNAPPYRSSNIVTMKEPSQSRSQSLFNVPMFGTLSAQSYDKEEPDVLLSTAVPSIHNQVQKSRSLPSNCSTPIWKRRKTESSTHLFAFATPLHFRKHPCVSTPSLHSAHYLPFTPVHSAFGSTNIRMTPNFRTSTPKLNLRPPLKELQLESLFASPSPHSCNLSAENNVLSVDGDNDQCPACTPQANRPLLDSWNFVHVLKSSCHTCSDHRQMVEDHKEMARQLREHSTRDRISHGSMNKHNKASVFDFPMDSDESPSFVPFSKWELQDLKRGVQVFGQRWQVILNAFNFHSSRTAAQLKDKYRMFQDMN
ncbi:telomere repeats-binding bouquet formation protein 1-like isoform X2 [Corticium candelabrum]|uniref:telomere repeats-binding bouquet formation protein 1-like isoform X2 n=1 Tax=Corticium candelabrum TaxID=121492 RepID=UPI002E276A69|nr:telomere repeats-binding bouquet formation protein 1-like isoform X2 [Corticium candelabrum]